MKPVSIPLEFTKGDDASVHLLFTAGGTPFDLTGWTFSASVRPQADPNVAPIEEFVVTLGPGVGEMTLRLEEDFTSTLPRRAYWSLRAYHVGTDLVQTWLAGNVRIDYTAESDTTANEYTIDVGADDIEVVAAANVGPTGATGAQGAPGLQGVAGEGVPPGGTTGQSLVKATATDFDTEWSDVAGGSGGAPTDAGYLVSSAHAGLSGEVVVGTTPGGELGGTWSAPTVDTTHAGSAHLALGSGATQAATGNHAHSGTYEPAGTVATHSADTTDVHGIADTSTLATTAYVSSTVNDLLASTPTAPNVKDYGAIGDGTSHPLSERYATLGAAQAVYPAATALTDEIDWAALQKVANLGKPAQVPTGTYLVNKAVVLSGGSVFWGHHPFGLDEPTVTGTWVKQKNAANLDAVICNSNWYNNSTTADRPCGIIGIGIDGNSTNQTSGRQWGYATSALKGFAVGCAAVNCGGGFLAAGYMRNNTTQYSAGVPEMRFHDCTARQCSVGFENDHPNITDGFITNCVAWEIYYDAIQLNHSAGWVVENNHTYGVGRHGIVTLNMFSTRVVANYSETWGQRRGGATPQEYDALFGSVSTPNGGGVIANNTILELHTSIEGGGYPAGDATGNAYVHGIHVDFSASGSCYLTLSGNQLYYDRQGNTPNAATTGIRLVKGAGATPTVTGYSTNRPFGWAVNENVDTGVLPVHLGALVFGDAGDTNLYRLAADVLVSDDTFACRFGQASQVAFGNVGPGGEAGTQYGSSGDAKMWRDGAGLLATADALRAGSFRVGSGGPTWTAGTGSPEGAVTAPVGSLYTRTDGGAATTLYVKESGTGNTGWTALGAAPATIDGGTP